MKSQIDVIALSRVNLSLLQNKVPLISRISMNNIGTVPIENAAVKITSDPQGVISGLIQLSEIPKDESYILENPRISHSWEFLHTIKEKIKGRLIIEVSGPDGELLGATETELDIEPESVWLGQQAPLELMACHVMPNSNAVQNVLRRASDKLKELTGSSALDGYQSKNRGRVHQIAQSIFQSLKDEQITYAEPPASFEETGQKVRNPEKVIEHRMATCLDISLFYTACLEQSGIYPLLFLVKGHAFVGFWLEDKFLPRPIEDDPQFFRKRIELDEMAVLDITGVTSDGKLTFQRLEEVGREHLKDEAKFVCGIDITNCRRLGRIHPLNDDGANRSAQSSGSIEANGEPAVFEKREFKEIVLSQEEKARDRELDKWKDKLLDLSFRNRLLNFKANKGTVEILCHSPGEMEDVLSSGEAFELLPEPKQNTLFEQRADKKEILADQITNSFARKKLLTGLTEEKFAGVMTGLFRSVVNNEEETGSNTLFLALGVLAWKETDTSDVVRKSPILLLPVELKRKSVAGRFTLELRDDDIVLNHTLLQKLVHDFGIKFPGLDPLPTDESGVDVPLILDIVRKVIRDKRGWEVLEEVWLSEFSFQKYLMWKELDSQYDKMLESPVIRRIMTAEVAKDTPEFISEMQVESRSHPKDIYCPLSADSSQMAAVLSAANGNSFVLQGPPGTGKSQTIANMIAHCIGIGKRVLFVSEKKVALEVVYRRLQEIGVAPFCLELHSKKSEKKEVVNSFYNALEFSAQHAQTEWESISGNLKTVRDGLNVYFSHLHEPSISGISAYRAFGVSGRNQTLPQIDLLYSSFLDHPEKILRETQQKLKSWQELASVLSMEDYLVWAVVEQDRWSSDAEDSMKVLLGRAIGLIAEIKTQAEKGAGVLPLNSKWKGSDWHNVQKLISHLLACPSISSDFLKKSDFKKFESEFNEHMAHLKAQSELRSGLSEIFQDQVHSLRFSDLSSQLKQCQEGFFIGKFFKRRAFKKRLQPLVKGEVREIETYGDHFLAGIRLQEGLPQEEKAIRFVREFAGGDYSTNVDSAFRASLAWASELTVLLTMLYASDLNQYIAVKSAVTGIIDNRSIALAPNGSIRSTLQELHRFAGDLGTTFDSLRSTLQLRASFIESTPELCRPVFEALLRTSSFFRDVAAMNKIKRELSSAGLSPLFKQLDAGHFDKSEAYRVFIYNFHRQWLIEKNRKTDALNNTTGLQLTAMDSDFKKHDSEYRKFSEKALAAKIADAKPKLGSLILPDSPVGLIVRETKKSRSHMPIRKFLDSVHTVAKSLKPCYLMSPMSVSQYLPVAPDFDIVIFDEASQIPPWDAIGALSRGKQAIIVGDTKQLPPTAFFSMNSDDESDEMVDCESVLEMFGGMFPEMLLKWHYRSRSESLINFSNHHIYSNRLHTFPSSNTDDHKVSLKVVEGENAYYDRSKSKTNQEEAKAVVAELFARLKDQNATKSIGVVTFSSVQATLISDLIDSQLQKESQLESYFDVSNPEYVFVKNLENVQGDERDVILFSIGYGKDQLGKIHKNFGPLNNSGGERRLNVAVTRARNEVKIFSNFHPREFDVSGSTSQGLKLLKEYLLYAQEGSRSFLRQETVASYDDFESPFEKQVAESLRDRGWEVRTQIGVGGYRIDLGVVHPDYPGRFLAGIECDGARYHSAKSARDRDILRQAVLEGLGWNVLRIWSTDWWYDNEKCVERIHTQLEILRSNSHHSEQQICADDFDEEDPVVEVKVDLEPESGPFPIQYSDGPVYDPAILTLVPSGEFFEQANLVSNHISEVVRKLAPISQEECFSLISRAWGFGKKGRRIEEFLRSCVRNVHETNSDGNNFFWNAQEDVATISELRLPRPGALRNPQYVAPEEMAIGVLSVLKSNFEVPRELLLKEVVKMLGYGRVAGNTAEAVQPALELLKRQGRIRDTDGLIVLVK